MDLFIILCSKVCNEHVFVSATVPGVSVRDNMVGQARIQEFLKGGG